MIWFGVGGYRALYMRHALNGYSVEFSSVYSIWIVWVIESSAAVPDEECRVAPIILESKGTTEIMYCYDNA